jgi:hypothetical protein
LRKKDSSFRLSSEKSGKERKPKTTRIIVLPHQFNVGIYSSFAALFSVDFFVRIKKMSAFKNPTTASRGISPQAQPQFYGTSYFLVRNTPTGQQKKRQNFTSLTPKFTVKPMS